VGTDAPARASLMYGLGRNNNGTGLVLASMALADHPRVMLPIILYNLVRQVAAGVVGQTIGRGSDRPDRPRHAIRSDQAARTLSGMGAPIDRPRIRERPDPQ